MSRQKRHSEKGFSLIELLIVVLIIGILAAIAIPNFIISRQSANAASAISSLRVIHSAESQHLVAHGRYGSLAELGALRYIEDNNLVSGAKSSYSFTIPATYNFISYQALAAPVVPGQWAYFFVDETGVIRIQMGSAASAVSPQL